VTSDQVIYQRRLAVPAHAAATGNVAETCRVFGISRTRFYEWQRVAQRYGVEALTPKTTPPAAAERHRRTSWRCC
jgi:hypothetical protein